MRTSKNRVQANADSGGAPDCPAAQDGAVESESFAGEYSAAALGDKRLYKRAVLFGNSAFRHCESSLPTMAGGANPASRLYKFLANARVTQEGLQAGFRQATVARAREAGGPVLLIGDTTTLTYGQHTKRTGLGVTAGGGVGFQAHVTLVVQERQGRPVGVSRCMTFARQPASPPPAAQTPPPPAAAATPSPDGQARQQSEQRERFRSKLRDPRWKKVWKSLLAFGNGGNRPPPASDLAQQAEPQAQPPAAAGKPKTKRGSGARKPGRSQDDPDNESHRWLAQALLAAKDLQGVPRVHVFDREADDYKTLCGLVQAGEDFVVRVCADRVMADRSRLSETLGGAVAILCRSVHINARKTAVGKKNQKTHPAREERVATLQISATTSTVPRSTHAPRSAPKSLTLNYVRVCEIDTPPECEPVQWCLETTLPIATAEQVERVVDIYCMRWLIEEFWKSLKTGCHIDRHQNESFGALAKLLTLCLPVAWKLLDLRTASRQTPQAPAAKFLTAEELTMLRALHGKQHPKAKLPAKPTISQAVWAIAALGGHFASNGEPGWLVLSRGWQRVADGLAAMRAMQALLGANSS